MKQHELRPPAGAHRERTRVGRGHGSGKGKTAGRGTKGQKARSGGQIPPYFEGGQLPLVRRLPYRRGFHNPFRVEFQEVHIRQLAARFPPGSELGPEELAAAGLIDGLKRPVKVLSDGEIMHPLTVRAHRFSAAARAKIEAAGGTVQELMPRQAEEGDDAAAATRTT